MPLFEYICPDCGAVYEEICPADAPAPACPSCGSLKATRQISMPSPLKTGAFPFKPCGVHPLGAGGRMSGAGCSSCASAGKCPTAQE